MEEVMASSDDGKTKNPSPLDFVAFLPWACHELQVKDSVEVTRALQTDYTSVGGLSDRSKKKGKMRGSKIELGMDTDKEYQSYSAVSDASNRRGSGVQILAIYDNANHLIELKLLNNKGICSNIFKIMSLIIQYHEYLSSITINRGLEVHGLYEICKLLPYSHLTDVCLDNTFIKEANFHLLLEQRSMLRHLSLSRCGINDAALEKLAAALIYPLPASHTLCILNLATNRITDDGIKYLTEAFRSNRKLSYLNLSDNSLTDCGVNQLFNILLKFPLTTNELLTSRSRLIAYLKEKNEVAMKIAKDLRSEDGDKRANKRKSAKSIASPSRKIEREASAKSIPEARNVANIDHSLLEKATAMAENALGAFEDPFDNSNIVVINSITYCNGNNTLGYLNVAYNNLSYLTVEKLLKVLKYQKEMNRQPRGLINVSIEGNCLPVACPELSQIDNLLEMGLMVQNRRFSLQKKRPVTKSGTR